MARPSELIPGNCYFAVRYYDDDLLIPDVETLIYRNEDEFDDGRRVWVFNYPSDTNTPDDATPVGYPDDQLYQVLDLPGLLKKLAGLQSLHPRYPPPARMARQGIAGIERAALQREVARFTADPDRAGKSVTIQFTDEGFSLGVKEGFGVTIGFFPQPTEDDLDTRIMAFFATREVAAQTNYLADQGRTRVIEFAIAGDSDWIEQLCADVLTQIFDMREDDVLEFR